MTHARESLETFLGDIEPTVPSDSSSERSVIREIFPEIEMYRQRGYSLSAIHNALVRGGDLSCKMTTFRTYYYRERHQRQLLSELSEPQTSDTTVTPAQISVSNESEQPTSPPLADCSASDALLSMSDAAIKSQQALARRMFDQRRAELGMRRRGE